MELTTKNLTNCLLKGAMVYAFALDGGNTSAQAADGPATPDAVTAIDILLLPDATMLQHAQATNDGSLPTRSIRHGGEEAQGMGPEALSHLSLLVKRAGRHSPYCHLTCFRNRGCNWFEPFMFSVCYM